MVALTRNKMRSMLTVLGITIGIAAVICVVAIGKAGQARVEQQLNNLGDNFVWIEAGGRAVNGVRTGTHDTKTLVMADAHHAFDMPGADIRAHDPSSHRGEGGLVTMRYNPMATAQAHKAAVAFFTHAMKQA